MEKTPERERERERAVNEVKYDLKKKLKSSEAQNVRLQNFCRTMTV